MLLSKQWDGYDFLGGGIKKVGGKLSIDKCDENEKKYLGMPEWIDLNRVGKLKFYNSIDSKEIIKRAMKLRKMNL